MVESRGDREMRLLPALLPVMLGAPLAVWQDTVPDTPGLVALRTIVRVAIGLLIVVLLSYIVVEQVGSRRRRRTGGE